MIDVYTICIKIGGMLHVPCEHFRINIGCTIDDAKTESVVPFFSDILRFPLSGEFVTRFPVRYLSVKYDVTDTFADSDFCEILITES